MKNKLTEIEYLQTQRIFLKGFVLIMLLYGFAIKSFGQNKHYSVGIGITPGISGFHGEGKAGSDYKFKYALAYSFQYSFTKNLSLNTGLVLDRKGARNDVTLTDISGNIIGKYEAYENLDYLVVPFMAKASFGKKNVKFFAGAGFYAGYLLQAKYKIPEEPSINGVSISNQDIKSYFKSFDFGVLASIGLILDAGKNFCFSAELVENYGLANILENGDLKNNSLGLSLGVAYKFGKK